MKNPNQGLHNLQEKVVFFKDTSLDNMWQIFTGIFMLGLFISIVSAFIVFEGKDPSTMGIVLFTIFATVTVFSLLGCIIGQLAASAYEKLFSWEISNVAQRKKELAAEQAKQERIRAKKALATDSLFAREINPEK